MPYSHTDQENGFLKTLGVSIYDLQPLAKGCTEVRKNIVDFLDFMNLFGILDFGMAHQNSTTG